MNWDKGFSAAYYATIVDPATWMDIKRIELTGGMINRTSTDLRESADIDCVNYEEAYECWIRIYLDARQAGGAAHLPIFTGLASSPKRNIDGTRSENKVQCYSVLQPASDILLPKGWYAARSFEASAVIQKLLKVCGAPVEANSTPKRLSDYIIAEQGETNLSMVNKILDATGYRLRIRGDGTIEICDEATEPAATFGATSNDVLETKITVEHDLFKCPNVIRVISGEDSIEYRDDDPASPLSTVSRGREVWKEDSSATLFEGESIRAYAKRRLKDLQRSAQSAQYDRRFHPNVLPSDIVRLNYPAQDLVGDFRVETQKITLGHGAKTSEEVVRI